MWFSLTPGVDRLRVANARLIAGPADGRLARLERGVPRAIVLGALPLALRLLFSRKAARGLDGVPLNGTVELAIRRPDGGEPDRFEVVIGGGRCGARRGAASNPGARVEIGLADMVRLGSGAVDPGFFLADGIAAGRVALKGDVFLFLAFPNVFRMANRKLI
jgi:hypothetical protein